MYLHKNIKLNINDLLIALFKQKLFLLQQN